MSSWSHTLLGKYDISQKMVGLDWGRLFLDPVAASGVFAHELSHGVIAEFDFGQATNNFFMMVDHFKHLTPSDREEMQAKLYLSQQNVQEGMATFLQLYGMKEEVGKHRMWEWAADKLPPEYLERVKKLEFVFAAGKRYRDLLTDRITKLSMETGIRKNAAGLEIFKTKKKFMEYLADEDHNPDVRYHKLIGVLKYYPWLITKPIPDIAKACGVKYFGPPTKAEVADFLNYICSFTPIKEKFTEAHVKESPEGPEAFLRVADKLVVGNMNIDIKNTSEFLYRVDDLIFYSDVIEAVIILPHNLPNDPELEKKIGEKLEVDLVAFRPGREKYHTAMAMETASRILKEEFSHITFLTKEGGFDFLNTTTFGSKILRFPDVVIYNRPEAMLADLEKIPDEKLLTCHLSASPNHPFQTLLLKAEGKPLMAVNTFGIAGINLVLSSISDRRETFSEKNLLKEKKHINNLFAIWMGMPWGVDWVRSMQDQKNLYLRDGSIYKQENVRQR